MRTHGTDAGNSDGRQILSHDPSHDRPLPNMSTALLPPKPLETDMASGSSWRFTSPLSQSTPGLSMGSASRSVGSNAPERTAMIVIAASNAPAAPRQCPKYDFVEDTGMGRLRPRKAVS